MTKSDVLTMLAEKKINVDEASKLLEQFDNGSAARKNVLTCKVSQKGALSVYGLQRMPVTLYIEQWERLLDFADSVREFAKSNDKQLTRKHAK